MQLALVDLKKQYHKLKNEIDSAIQKTLESGSYILGDNVCKFEEEIASFCNTKFAVGVASGTDALELSLRALGIEKDDEVITTPFTFIANAEAICRVGAKPVFADIDLDTYNINPAELRKKVTQKTKAIIPVHLYGQPCDMDKLMQISQEYNLKIIEDCCQAIGAEYKNKKVGSFGDTGCFSFFPTKNLSTYGDGGMVVTNNKDAYELLKMLRVHGSRNKYFHIHQGLNSRLDELHAAILRVKISHIQDWNNQRRKLAKIYNDYFKEANLTNIVICPKENNNVKHVYHIYAVRVKNRDALRDYLQKNGISSGMHYPLGLHMQEVYKKLNYKQGDFPNTELAASEVISLPMYPELKEQEIAYVIKTITDFYKNAYIGK